MKIVTDTKEIQIDYAGLGLIKGNEPAYYDSFILKNTIEVGTHPCIVVVPGGGYHFTADRESEHIATQFMAKGFSAFVLHYSVAPARYPCSLIELCTLMKHIRDNAEAYEIDPKQIAVIGFSAGGHLTASLGAFWNKEEIKKLADINNEENKPNALILSYPVITGGDKAHKGSLRNLMGAEDEKSIYDFSIENHITDTFPPCFIWHTAEDATVPVENSLYLATALSREKVPYELHIYPEGPHGLGLANKQTWEGKENLLVPRVQDWVEKAISFLTEVAFLQK